MLEQLFEIFFFRYNDRAAPYSVATIRAATASEAWKKFKGATEFQEYVDAFYREFDVPFKQWHVQLA